MGFEIVLIIALALLSIYFLLSRANKLENRPPGPSWRIPILGHLPFIGLKPYETFMKWSKAYYGPVFSVQMGSFPSLILNDTKTIKEAFNDNAVSGRPAVPIFHDRSSGTAKGIIFTEGTKWQEQRRFTLRHLRDFGFGRKSMEAIIAEEALELTDRLKAHEGKPISTDNAFNAAIINALWSLLTGDRFKQDDPELAHALQLLTASIKENKFLQGVATFIPWLTKTFPNATGYTKILKDIPEVTSFIWKTIPFHEETFQEGVYRDFLDVYISEVRKTTDLNSPFHKNNSEMDWVLVDLFVAGTETTSTALSWTFLLLAKYPDIQKKLHAEIDSVVGTSRQPCLADRPQMPYSQAIMHEILRFTSFVPFGVFHSTNSDTEIAGYFVPKGTMILPNIWGVHHDEAIWGDPSNFRPERFIKNGEFERHESLLAFATGKRVCLGENLARDEYFLFLTTLFQRFDVRVDGDIDLEPIMGGVLSPKTHQFVLKVRN